MCIDGAAGSPRSMVPSRKRISLPWVTRMGVPHLEQNSLFTFSPIKYDLTKRWPDVKAKSGSFTTALAVKPAPLTFRQIEQ